MSDEQQKKMPVTLLGGGCASLSLAARSNEFNSHKFTLIEQKDRIADDHTWGFWAMPWLSHVVPKTHKSWNHWRIISTNKTVELSSQQHPYCAISRHEWLNHCRAQAIDFGAVFSSNSNTYGTQQVLDSRTPATPENAMLQHFLGHEVTSDKDVFEPSTAILMDFRCDQSQGMHFIYFLPFTSRHALVESTLFSTKLVPQIFYENAITQYLEKNLGCKDYAVKRIEQGVIPLAELQQLDPKITGIGANGGAIRPSSGYAFTFIHKQIDQIVSTARPGQPLLVNRPHSHFELFMDGIFLNVIRCHPALAPKIFMSLASGLTGDEFAKFLSGEASVSIWFKVILAMPKLLFLRALLPAKESKKI